ncbi:MAG: prenyltransferase/squalene oxidase repeat-containing protein [Anaerolineae bacterium]|jgi:hypothetical protein
MSRKILIITVLLSALAAFAAPVRASDTIDEALDWIKSQQEADGGFGSGFSEGSDLGATCDVVLAVAAAGQDPSRWTSTEGNSPLDYLYSQVASGEPGTVSLRAKVSLALLYTRLDPADFAGRDLILQLQSAYNEETGSYGGNIFDQALVMLALFNAGQPVPEKAAQFLLDHQTDDGAWALFGDTAAGTGDTNTTALAIQALLATGHRDDIGEAFAYLRRVQNDDGGFPYQAPSAFGTDTDANSTAYVLQALLAADEPIGLWAASGTDPLGALAALRDPDTGALFWQASVPFPNLVATAQAVPAVAGHAFVNIPRVHVTNAPQR